MRLLLTVDPEALHRWALLHWASTTFSVLTPRGAILRLSADDNDNASEKRGLG